MLWIAVMPKDAFKRRSTALEDEFFRRVDDELAEKLREKWKHERDIKELQQESRIHDAAVLEELLYVGVKPGTLHAVTLIPAIHVAWANGFVETKERAAVLHAAETVGIVETSTTGKLLVSWLEHKPTSELFQVWQDYIQALKAVVNITSYRHLHENAVRMASDIASAAGGVLGVHATSVAEQRAIKQIDEAF